MTALPWAWALLVVVSLVAHGRRPPRRRFEAVTAPSALRQVRAPVRRRSGPSADRRRRAEVATHAPDLVDLVAVAVAAGLNVRLTVAVVAARLPPGTLRDALVAVEAEVATGDRLADALERLPRRLGGRLPADEVVRSLVAALVDAERYGTPLGATLDRLAADARRSRQRRAEERARRIPVLLLFPLVTCILPAFGLLTVVPLIAGGLRALRL